MSWFRRIFRRRRPLPDLDPARAERAAVLAVEMRVHAAKIVGLANELAAVHGIERRVGETGADDGRFRR